MDVKLSIREEDVGLSNPIKGEVKQDEMDSLKEEEIWRGRQERMNTALAAARTMTGQDRAEWDAATQRLVDVIRGANVDEFIDMIEMSADQTDLSAIFDDPWLYSLLDIAADACRYDFLRLLLSIVIEDDWGDTPLHKAAKNREYTSVEKLIHLARHLPNVEEKNRILRMKNKRGNAVLHEAVLNCEVEMVLFLLREDPELMYLKNAEQKSPLYLALDTSDNRLQEALFSLSLEPSRIQGMPPVHGAVVRNDSGLLAHILRTNMKLFAMTDSRGGNVFHFAAYAYRPQVFELLDSKIDFLVKKRDMDGDLPIHIASKRGFVDLIEKLYPVSKLLNGQGQTVLHVAAKCGQASTVRYILRHPELGKLINERDHAGNTPLHLGAMYSQPAALIALLLDKRIDPFLLNHECLTAGNIARYICNTAIEMDELTIRVDYACVALESTPAVITDLLVLKPESRDKVLSIVRPRKRIQKMDQWKDWINARLLVAALVATVTFTAGFAVPGGFNSSDTATKDYRGMATMLDRRRFQAFAICNTIAMFSSMMAVIALMFAQTYDFHKFLRASAYAMVPLAVALPAMSATFLTGVSLTVGKLPWLANTIFYPGLVFLLIISSATLLQYLPVIRSHRRPILLLLYCLILTHIYLWGIPTYIMDDSEEDGKARSTSTSQPPDGAGGRKTVNSVKPHFPNH